MGSGPLFARRVVVRWTARALRDVRSIRDYIGRQSPYALQVARRLLDRADLLAEHPAAGRAVPEYERPDVRELVEPPAVYVLAVVHGRQRLPGWP